MQGVLRPEASAGSAPAASLKLLGAAADVQSDVDRIRGVCPRGLIEASREYSEYIIGSTLHPRGLPPRPH